MVEALAAGVGDKLIDGLSFKLGEGASYITDRKSSTFHPSGGNEYSASSSGAKLIKFNITSDGWLDPSSFRLMFNLNSVGTVTAGVSQELRPVSGPWAFFSRMRILCGGQIIEDISEYNRCHEMFSILTAKDSRQNDNVEGFGNNQDVIVPPATGLTLTNYPGIKCNESRTVLFKPLSGLLAQDKYLPLRYMNGLTIELELVNKETDPVISNMLATAFSTTNTTTSWTISEVQVKCDICTLDSGLENSYSELLLSGKALPINYNTYVSQFQTSTGQKVRLNVTRTLTRLKSIFVTLNNTASLTDTALNVNVKEWNNFWSPMESHTSTIANVNSYSQALEVSDFQISIGAKNFPEYPLRSHAECYYQLKKALGVQASALHSFDISSQEYRNRRFILGFDTEKVLSMGFTGENLRSGSIMSIRFDHASAATTPNVTHADTMHIVLHSDNIMEIRDSGVAVFD